LPKKQVGPLAVLLGGVVPSEEDSWTRLHKEDLAGVGNSLPPHLGPMVGRFVRPPQIPGGRLGFVAASARPA